MKIAIVKRNSLLREIIMDVIQTHLPDYSISAYKQSTYPAVDFADLVILDTDPAVDLVPVCKSLHSTNKKVIIWTSNLESENLICLLKLNLNEYFFSGMGEHELILAMEKIVQGKKYIHPSLLPLHNQHVSSQQTTSTLVNGKFTMQE